MMCWDWFNSLSASYTNFQISEEAQWPIEGVQTRGLFYHQILDIWHFSEVSDVSEEAQTPAALAASEQHSWLWALRD